MKLCLERAFLGTRADCPFKFEPLFPGVVASKIAEDALEDDGEGTISGVDEAIDAEDACTISPPVGGEHWMIDGEDLAARGGSVGRRKRGTGVGKLDVFRRAMRDDVGEIGVAG